MKILHLSQALTNNGKVSKYLENQLNDGKGFAANVLDVIYAIESGKNHEFMKKAGKLKMFGNLNLYHHHVNWNLPDNLIWSLNRDPEYKVVKEKLVSEKVQVGKAIQDIEPLILKSMK